MARKKVQSLFRFNASQAFLSALFFLIITAPSLYADTDAIHASDNAVWLSGGVDLFAYKEQIPPPTITDSERDGIASFAAGASWLGTEYDIYAALEGSVSFGNADYSGSYLYFPETPLKGTTRETISTIGGKIGQAFTLNEHIMLIPYGELGYRYWQRNLGGGQEEDYQNYDALGGLMVQVSPFNDVVLSLYGAAGGTIDPKMNTSGLTFDLGSSAIYKAGGKIGYDINEQVEIFTTLDFEHFTYDQSSPVYIYEEPTSITNETAVRVGVAYHF